MEAVEFVDADDTDEREAVASEVEKGRAMIVLRLGEDSSTRLDAGEIKE